MTRLLALALTLATLTAPQAIAGGTGTLTLDAGDRSTQGKVTPVRGPWVKSWSTGGSAD